MVTGCETTLRCATRQIESLVTIFLWAPLLINQPLPERRNMQPKDDAISRILSPHRNFGCGLVLLVIGFFGTTFAISELLFGRMMPFDFFMFTFPLLVWLYFIYPHWILRNVHNHQINEILVAQRKANEELAKMVSLLELATRRRPPS